MNPIHLSDLQDWAKRAYQETINRKWLSHPFCTIQSALGIRIGQCTPEQILKLKPWLKERQKLVKAATEAQEKEGRQLTPKEMDLLVETQAVSIAITYLEADREDKKKEAGASPAPAPAPKLKIPDEEKPSEVLAAVNHNGDEIVDARFISSLHEFTGYIVRARRQLGDTKDFEKLVAAIAEAELLRRLADAIDSSDVAAIQARAYEVEARYKRSQLILEAQARGEVKTKGGRNKSGKSLSEILPSKTDQNWNSCLAKFSPKQFEERLETGLNDKTLSRNTFSLNKKRKKPNPPTRGIENAKSMPAPHRLLISLCADMRSNIGSYPFEGEYFEHFLNNSILMENFRKVGDHLARFLIELFKADRARQQAAQKLSPDNSVEDFSQATETE